MYVVCVCVCARENMNWSLRMPKTACSTKVFHIFRSRFRSWFVFSRRKMAMYWIRSICRCRVVLLEYIRHVHSHTQWYNAIYGKMLSFNIFLLFFLLAICVEFSTFRAIWREYQFFICHIYFPFFVFQASNCFIFTWYILMVLCLHRNYFRWIKFDRISEYGNASEK